MKCAFFVTITLHFEGMQIIASQFFNLKLLINQIDTNLPEIPMLGGTQISVQSELTT
jgi:hypothetical protein